MSFCENIESIDFSGITKIIIAPSVPKFSEVWMLRINQILGKQALFIAMQGDLSKDKIEDLNLITLSKRSLFPERIDMSIKSRKIRSNLKKVLDRIPKNSIILCHYLTTAVFFKDIIKKSPMKFFVYCHGHDVTWKRKIENFPYINAHPSSYQKNVAGLINYIRVIANSNATKKKLKEVGFLDENIFINHLSVDTDEMKPTLKKYNKYVKILYLGRLTDFKGPLETIKAFIIALDKGLKGELNIVGDGPKMRRCKSIISSSKYKKNIFLHGAVNKEKAKKFFMEADIFTAHNQKSIKTNQEEAFGVSIIEAMAFGIPVVTGKSGGVIETVQDKKTGILFKSGDLEGHSRALLELANNIELRKFMGKNARKRAIDFFDIRNEKTKLLKILNN